MSVRVCVCVCVCTHGAHVLRAGRITSLREAAASRIRRWRCFLGRFWCFGQHGAAGPRVPWVGWELRPHRKPPRCWAPFSGSLPRLSGLGAPTPSISAGTSAPQQRFRPLCRSYQGKEAARTNPRVPSRRPCFSTQPWGGLVLGTPGQEVLGGGQQTPIKAAQG